MKISFFGGNLHFSSLIFCGVMSFAVFRKYGMTKMIKFRSKLKKSMSFEKVKIYGINWKNENFEKSCL